VNKHEKGVNRKGFNKKRSNINFEIVLCNKWQIERQKWMGTMTEEEGTFSCPKCQSKLGGYKWSGEQCSCGVWLCPSINLAKSKVDL